MNNRILPACALSMIWGVCLIRQKYEIVCVLSGFILLFICTICMSRIRGARSERRWRSEGDSTASEPSRRGGRNIIRRKYVLMIALCIIFTLLGMGRGWKEELEWARFAAQIKALEESEETGIILCAMIRDVRHSGDGMQLRLTGVRDEKNECFPNGILYLKDDTETYYAGEWIVFCGAPELFEEPVNPGQFDMRAYYRSNGIWWSIYEPDWICETQKDGGLYSGFLGAVYRLRRQLSKAVGRCSEEPYTAVYRALLLGEREYLPDEMTSLLAEHSLIHIFSISGMHLSLIVMGAYRLLRRLHVPLRLSALAAAVVLTVYLYMSGAGVSGMRAGIMLSFYLLAQMSGKTYEPYCALSAAVIWILLREPQQLWQSGFLYSAASAAAVHFVSAFDGAAERERRREKGAARFRRALYTALLVAAASLGITVWNNGAYPLHSIVLNLCIVPLLPFVWLSALLSAGLGWCGAGIPIAPLGSILLCAGRLAQLPARWVLGGLLYLCGNLSNVSFAGCASHLWGTQGALTAATGRPQMWKLICYYGLLWLGVCVVCCRNARLKEKRLQKRLTGGEGSRRFSRYELRLRGVLLAALVCAAPFCLRRSSYSGLTLAFLDVGQGDCCVVSFPDGSVGMIDAGSSSVASAGSYRILPYLDYIGSGRRLDYVWLSHCDSDHIGAVEELLEAGCRISSLILSFTPYDTDTGAVREEMQPVMALLAQTGADTRLYYMQAGDCLTIGDCSVICLLPETAGNAGENDDSMVLYVGYAGLHALFTGDISGGGAEEALTARYGDGAITADILKVAHHGSKYSTEAAFLEWAQPRLAVISCGTNNYGHPAPETLERLTECGSAVLITQEGGAVLVHMEESGILVERGK